MFLAVKASFERRPSPVGFHCGISAVYKLSKETIASGSRKMLNVDIYINLITRAGKLL